MNIGIVCSELPPGPTGGIGIFTAELVRGLTTFGHRVRLACIDNGVQSDVTEVVSHELTIHRLAGSQERLRGYLNRAKLFLLIRKWAAERTIDIVEVPDFEGWCAGWPRLPVPVVVRLHGSATYFATEMASNLPASTRLLERLAIRRADHILSVSRYTADRTSEMFRLTLSPTVIYNSVMLPELPRIKNTYASTDLVCYSGTMVRKKGVFALARAWPSIKLRRPHARLMMIGKDAWQEGRSSIEIMRGLAGSYADSIDFVGHRPKPEMEELLTSADVAVYPSYSEAFALAPMESMSLAVPTIYTTRASGPELIRHSIDGWLCDPDNIEGLADSVVTLLESQAIRNRLGEAGRRRISRDFRYPVSLQKNLDFYRECISQPRNVSISPESSSVLQFPTSRERDEYNSTH